MMSRHEKQINAFLVAAMLFSMALVNAGALWIIPRASLRLDALLGANILCVVALGVMLAITAYENER